MQKPFLQRVAEEVYQKFGDEISRCIFIFPNKRPESALSQILAALIKNPVQAPKILSIEEFIFSHSTLKQADALQQIFILYKIYKKYVKDEDFDTFYAWGTLLLKDYDEIDRYLVDSPKLFANLKAIKEIDAEFAGDFKNEGFEEALNEAEPHYLQKRFTQLWEIFRALYFDFKAHLQNQGLAYPGMAYREVAENCIHGKTLVKAQNHLVFVGFNALSKAEEQIIQSHVRAGSATVYWDADLYYLENEREEAGHFIRQAIKKLPPTEIWQFDNSLRTEPKTVNIIGVPLKVGQAKALGVEVKKHFSDIVYMENAAVVLPDENLLLPVLHALPHNAITIYSTSGYPLANTSFYALCEHLFALQENLVQERKAWYFKDVIGILSHPFIRTRNHAEVKELVDKIEAEEWVYVEQDAIVHLFTCPILELIFREVTDTQSIYNYITDVYDNIVLETTGLSVSERIMMAEVKTLLQSLREVLLHHDLYISKNTFIRLFREHAAKARVPMSSPKNNALQVMGVLETRSLSFETVFMPSVNEGTMPGSKRNHSYIPYQLRKNFGLPTFDEQDALYAYYFFRLLQSAKEIYLFYNSETGSKGEEKSRYIRQVEYYLVKENPLLKIQHRYYSLPLKTQSPQEIIIEKDTNYFERISAKSEKTGLSPSLISAYFSCSLQFLINHVIQLRAREDISEDMDASQLGILYHGVMENLYKPFLGHTIYADGIKDCKNRLPDAMNDVLIGMYTKESQKEFMERRNSLLIETVKVLAEKTLDADLKYAPFKILHLEETLYHTITFEDGTSKPIKLKGTIDRVDEKDGLVRIVDYKTGQLNRKYFNFSSEEESITSDNKEAFQTLFYTYLYKKLYGASRLQPTILPLKAVNEGFVVINEKDGELKDSDFEAFENKLKEIIHTILDESQPIVQVEDRNVCSYCNYTYICLR